MKNIRYWPYLSSSSFDKSSPKSSSRPPRSRETLTQIDVNDKDTLVVDSEEGFTSHDLIATADENSFTSGGGMVESRVTEVISPVSSIEVINNFSAANDAENMPLGSDSHNNLVSEVLVQLFSKTIYGFSPVRRRVRSSLTYDCWTNLLSCSRYAFADSYCHNYGKRLDRLFFGRFSGFGG